MVVFTFMNYNIVINIVYIYIQYIYNIYSIYRYSLYLCKQRETFLYKCLITCLRKSTSEVELLVFFTFFNFFWKHSLIQSIIYYQPVHAFGPFTYVPVCCEKCMSGFSAFVLTTGNILLDQCQMKIVSSTQHLCHW